MKLVLENKEGQTVRTFSLDGEDAILISRKDTRRVEIHTSVQGLEDRGVKFERLANIRRSELEQAPLKVGQGRLRVMSSPIRSLAVAVPLSEDESNWKKNLTVLGLIHLTVLGLLLAASHRASDEQKEEVKTEIVQIIKPVEQKQVRHLQPHVVREEPKTIAQHSHPISKPHVTKTASIKRVGALAVFGSNNSSRQRGGVNLGAVNSSRGPGLGGTQGSGGMQTTLYGRGLVAAPVGAGANLNGQGGYETHGRGGGQAGYGKMSLIGSAGDSTIPLGREALIEGGMDRDAIEAVINRNMGQIRYCYEQGLQEAPRLSGRVAVRFTIGGRGVVSQAGVENTTLGSRLVEQCIVSHLRSWKFPNPERGVSVNVSYPFLLKRAGRA